MKILAIDPAVNMGWAFLNEGKLNSGVWFLGNNRKLHQGHYFVSLYKRLQSFNQVYGTPDFLVYEKPGNLFGHARKILPGFQAILEMWAIMSGVDVQCFNASPIKHHATGKGNASKEDMVEAAERRWPHITIERHDQADALWVLDYFVNGRK